MYMSVILISYSQAVPDILEKGISTMTDLVAFCARVSNPSNQLKTEQVCFYSYWLYHPALFLAILITLNTFGNLIARQLFTLV